MHRDKLIDQLAAGRVVAIVGAGVSKALTGGDEVADWVGLIRNGISRVSTEMGVSANWADLQELNLEEALTSGGTDDLISVATNISIKFKGSSEQAYSNWLTDTVGALRARHTNVAKGLEKLRTPILTTNYDTLLETALKRDSVNWTNPDGMRNCFIGETKTVGHLHGVWNAPDTVIFSQSDYERILQDKRAQFVQQSHYSTKSFLYIGYGGGLGDPNFNKMLEEHQKLFPVSSGYHFRLCLEAEVDDLQSHHRDSDIRVLSYGENYTDLENFLVCLAQDAYGEDPDNDISRDALAFARERIVHQIQAEGAIQSDDDSEQFVDLDDVTVAPVLLPMSHEQFASMQTVEGGPKPERLDPYDVAKGKKLVVVVGEDHSGLTTTLRWLVAKAALEMPGVAPIYVDARLGLSSTHPINKMLRREALNLRLTDREFDPIPPHTLAIDNVVYRENHTYDRLIGDLMAVNSEYLAIGCRLGEEQYIIRSLEGHRLPIEIVHIGKMGRPEVQALATLIAPGAPSSLCDSVLEISRRERLPRNPFTVALLISLVLQLGQRNDAYNSETAVLDEYVKLLLGANRHIDGRLTLTAQNREKIIANIAKIFVRRRKGSLPYSEVIKQMEGSFEELAWREDPIRWLDAFSEARVLRLFSGEVQFQQSSYLHLFAAKAAISDESFRDEMFEDPLYFAPIIRHYAALLRNSRFAVERVGSLLNPWQEHPTTGRAFGRIERSSAPDLQAYADDESGAGDNKVEPEEDTGRNSEPSHKGAPAKVDYDVSDDTDIVPFPLTDQEDLSPAIRLANSVDLTSRVVRDSDELEDRSLKAKVLGKALIAWGVLVDEFESEEVFRPAIDTVIEHMREQENFDEERIEHLVGRVELFLPSFYVLAGIQATLTSRKLLIAVQMLMEEEEFLKSDFGPVAAAMFAFLLPDDGWSEHLPALAESHGDRWVVTGMLASLAHIAYVEQTLSKADEDRLLEFLKNCETKRWTFDSPAHRSRHLGQFEQRLKLRRKLNARERLTTGKAAAGNMLS